MSIDFSNIKLEVIDLYTSMTPEIFINVNGVTFSKRVVDDLGYPQNVQYCTDPEHHIFAIKPCKSNEVKAAPFAKPKSETSSGSNTISSVNKNLHDLLCALIPNYAPRVRYRVVGEFNTENRVMYFDMSTAEESSFRKTAE